MSELLDQYNADVDSWITDKTDDQSVLKSNIVNLFKRAAALGDAANPTAFLKGLPGYVDGDNMILVPDEDGGFKWIANTGGDGLTEEDVNTLIDSALADFNPFNQVLNSTSNVQFESMGANLIQFTGYSESTLSTVFNIEPGSSVIGLQPSTEGAVRGLVIEAETLYLIINSAAGPDLVFKHNYQGTGNLRLPNDEDLIVKKNCGALFFKRPAAQNPSGYVICVGTVGGSSGGSSADASTTVKGIVKLSTAPVSATEPIAVGDNDPRMTNARTPTSHTHTKSEIADFPTLGSAAALDVPSSGNATSGQVVKGSDSRLHTHDNKPTLDAITGHGSLTYNSSSGLLTFTGTSGAQSTADLPIENLFQNASYDSGTKDLTLTTVNGGTIIVPLDDLMDVAEIQVSASSDPGSTPSTGQRLYLRADNGNYWIASAGAWAGPFECFTAAKVRAVDLTGVDTGLTGTPTASDTLLSFAGKVINFISSIAATVLGTVLTGLSTATNSAVTAADSILVGIGKLQAQVTGKQDSLTETNFGSFSNGLTSKATPVDADSFNLIDSADSNKAKKLTVSNFKTWWAAATATLTNKTIDGGSNTVQNLAASAIASGTFADSRIAQSNVTQHQAALSIGQSQVTGQVFEVCVACSDEVSDLASGTSKAVFRIPFAITITNVYASVNTAPSGSTIVVDINEGGTSILSTKLSIDASEKTSTTAATAAVISDASIAADAELSIDIDQVGATTAGKGLKVFIKGTR